MKELTRDQKIESLFPLARILACKWQTFPDKSALDREDMISEAYIACIGAVDSYDPSFGRALVPHAHLCIQRHLQTKHIQRQPETRNQQEHGEYYSIISLDAVPVKQTDDDAQSVLDTIFLTALDTTSTYSTDSVFDIVSDKMERENTRALLDSYMLHLNAKEAMIVQCLMDYDAEYKEIAARTGYSVKQVDNVLVRAKVKLQSLAALTAQGLPLPDEMWMERIGAKSVPRRIKKRP